MLGRDRRHNTYVFFFEGGPGASLGALEALFVDRILAAKPAAGQGVDQIAPQEGRLFDQPRPKKKLQKFLFGRSSCGLLVGSRWPWEAVEAIFVERMVGPKPAESQGIEGLGSQEGRLSKNWAQFF